MTTGPLGMGGRVHTLRELYPTQRRARAPAASGLSQERRLFHDQFLSKLLHANRTGKRISDVRDEGPQSALAGCYPSVVCHREECYSCVQKSFSLRGSCLTTIPEQPIYFSETPPSGSVSRPTSSRGPSPRTGKRISDVRDEGPQSASGRSSFPAETANGPPLLPTLRGNGFWTPETEGPELPLKRVLPPCRDCKPALRPAKPRGIRQTTGNLG
jgi:hypothetical protein